MGERGGGGGDREAEKEGNVHVLCGLGHIREPHNASFTRFYYLVLFRVIR